MIDIDKYHKAKLTEGPWKYKREEDTEDGDYRIYIVAGQYRIAKMITHTYRDAQLMADAPLLLEEVKRLRHLCDTLFIYAHNIETGQSTIEKSNGEPLSTIDFEKDMTWVNGVNQPKISNIKIGGISYLKIVDDSIHSDGEGDYVLATECNAGHLVGEIGYEDCPDCGGEQE